MLRQRRAHQKSFLICLFSRKTHKLISVVFGTRIMITLVSSYINYYKTPLERSTHLLRLGRFLPVLQLKIPLVIFTTHDCVEALHQYIQHHCPDFETYIRLIVLKKSFFESSWIHLTASKVAPEHLPTHRFVPKDTLDFLCYSHTKIEFLRQSTEINPFRTTHFAWVDCDIAQMFRHKNATSHFLKYVCVACRRKTCASLRPNTPRAKCCPSTTSVIFPAAGTRTPVPISTKASAGGSVGVSCWPTPMPSRICGLCTKPTLNRFCAPSVRWCGT